MVNLKVLVVFCAMIISVFGLGGSTVNFEPQPLETSTALSNSTTSAPPTDSPTSPPSSSTTAAPPSSSTTSAPSSSSTTAAPPTSSTTTKSPKTTTGAPNTTTTATTTTVKPTSSTPTPPTPKPTPTPDNPTVANWTVNYNNSNNSCIFIQVALQYVISVPNSNETIKINVPGEAQASGSCEGGNKQNLKVTWDRTNSLEFDFGKTNTSKFELDDLSSTLNVTLKSGPKIFNLVHEKPEFTTPLANSYKCARVQTLNFTEADSNVTIAVLHVSHLQYQAFQNTSEHKFDTALDCEGSITPDIVPIVVGCVLAALVIMVLIAYLVGRRRCQARGYLSMFAETEREEDYIPMKNLTCFN